MILVCGSANDRLVRELSGLAREHVLDVELLEERELFEGCPFIFETSGDGASGYFVVHGRKVDLETVDAVVLRLQRTWWPSASFDLQDQMFVYHETVASWFALLDGLHCPIMNRFGLGWWLHDAGYPLQLRRSLANVLGIPLSPASEERGHNSCIVPTARDTADGVESIYRAAGRFFAAPSCRPGLVTDLERRGEAFSAWEGDTGVSISRVDVEVGDGLRVKVVEPFPLFDGEPDGLVRAIVADVVGSLVSRREMTS
jgi:hypothetical protein